MSEIIVILLPSYKYQHATLPAAFPSGPAFYTSDWLAMYFNIFSCYFSFAIAIWSVKNKRQLCQQEKYTMIDLSRIKTHTV